MKRYSLRIPDDLWEWLRCYAEEHGRSLNNEILAILRQEKARAQRRKERQHGNDY